VWMLGKGRAIPRNYYHTVINDARINWLTSGQNYNDVIIKATKEAEGRHTFVTEFAGAATVMKNVLNGPGRYGNQKELEAQASEISFVDYLKRLHRAMTADDASAGVVPGTRDLAAQDVGRA